MVDRTEVPNNISLKLDSSGSEMGQKNSSLPFDKDKYPKELYDTYKAVISMMKIIMIGCISECSSFFAEYSNYEKLANSLRKLKLLDDRHPKALTVFSEFPMNYWCEITLAMFVSLFAMPNNANVECIRLYAPFTKENKVSNSSYGVVLTIRLVLEAHDWKEHSFSMFLPDDSNKYRSVILLDNEPVVITNKNASV